MFSKLRVFAFTIKLEYCINFTLILESCFHPIKWANATTNSEPVQTVHLSMELNPNNNIRQPEDVKLSQ